MAKVGIFKQTPEKYFDYEDDTEVLLRYVSKDAMSEVIKKADSAAKKLGTSSSKLYDIFLARAAVIGWRKKGPVPDEAFVSGFHPGLVMPDGAPFPYTPENRDAVSAQDRAFSAFVLHKSTDAVGFMDDGHIISDMTDEDLRGLEHLVKEDEEKNS